MIIAVRFFLVVFSRSNVVTVAGNIVFEVTIRLRSEAGSAWAVFYPAEECVWKFFRRHDYRTSFAGNAYVCGHDGDARCKCLHYHEPVALIVRRHEHDVRFAVIFREVVVPADYFEPVSDAVALREAVIVLLQASLTHECKPYVVSCRACGGTRPAL